MAIHIWVFFRYLLNANKINLSLQGKQWKVFVANDTPQVFKLKLESEDFIFYFDFNLNFSMIKDVEYLLMCLSTIYISSLVKDMFESLVYFLLYCLFSYYLVVRVFYMFWTKVLH